MLNRIERPSEKQFSDGLFRIQDKEYCEKETFSSIMGTFKEPLNPWINPVIDAATSADDFLLTDVRKKKMTVYIGILPNKLAESRVITCSSPNLSTKTPKSCRRTTKTCNTSACF